MWLEQQYIINLSSSLRNFRQLPNGQYNFSCPICGDSSKNPRKARGYLLLDSGKYRYYCHNCGISHTFYHFLKEVNFYLFEEYLRDMYREQKDKSWIERPQQDIKKNNDVSILPLLKLKKISSLRFDHPAKKFIVDRKIPNKFHAWLFYAPKFKEFTNTLLPNKFENIIKDEPRIIIPLLDQSKRLLGFQGRSLKKNSSPQERYITILLKPDNPKLFGLNWVDFNYRNYAVEGPFDSMFLNNAIASCGGKISTELKKSSCPIERTVIVYDNEPRNPDVVKNVESAIDEGFFVFIWPEGIKEKDINDIIISRDPRSDEEIENTKLYIQDMIDSNTHKGLAAKMRFVAWKRV